MSSYHFQNLKLWVDFYLYVEAPIFNGTIKQLLHYTIKNFDNFLISKP